MLWRWLSRRGCDREIAGTPILLNASISIKPEADTAVAKLDRDKKHDVCLLPPLGS